jgi:hypothetical protein
VTFKKVTPAFTGDSQHASGLDWNKIADYLTNIDLSVTDPVTINTLTTFRNLKFKLRNSTNTADYIFNTSSIGTNKNVNLPLLTADDTLVTQDFIQPITNKTINASSNIITDSGVGLGDLLVGDATGKYIRRAKGTANQVLSVTSDGANLTWSSPSTSSAIPQLYSYIIQKNGTVYEAVNTATGAVDSNSTTDASVPINFALSSMIGNSGTSGRILLKRIPSLGGSYVCLNSINIVESQQQGLGLVGEGSKATVIDFQPTSALTNGITLKMTNGFLGGMQIKVNSNVTNAIKLDGTGSDGTGGHMDDILIHGPNADSTGVPVSGQIGISHQTTSASYWWAFHHMKLRALDTGYISTGAGGGSTSSQWTSSKFQNCTKGMDISGTQHQGSNLYFQGTSSVGVHGIRLNGTAAGCLFSNVIGELNATGNNCQTVLLLSGAHHNGFVNIHNAQDNGTTFVTLRDQSAQTTNKFSNVIGTTV